MVQTVEVDVFFCDTLAVFDTKTKNKSVEYEAIFTHTIWSTKFFKFFEMWISKSFGLIY